MNKNIQKQLSYFTLNTKIYKLNNNNKNINL